MNVYYKVWLTSFGDLLTLMLCFFIVAIYQSGEAKKIKPQSNQVVAQKSDRNSDHLVTSGKQIASKKVTEFLHSALLLNQADFNPAFVGLSRQGSERLSNFLNENSDSLELGICNIDFEFGETVFEVLSQKVSSRKLSLSIGAKVCKTQKLLDAGVEDQLVLVKRQIS